MDEDAICWHTKIESKHIQGAWKGLERGIKGASGWVWVRRFLKHQKNEMLNPLNPAHKQILLLIADQVERFKDCSEFKEFIGAYKGLLRPIGTGTGTGTGKGKRESPERERQAEEIYQAYPLKKAKPEAIKAILRVLESGHDFQNLLIKTKAYASVRNGHLDFVPNPSTWFNQERFNDPPETWKPSNGDIPAPRNWKDGEKRRTFLQDQKNKMWRMKQEECREFTPEENERYRELAKQLEAFR